MITDRFVLWFDKKKRAEGSLVIFHNSEGPD
jgi:hypothetical protein